jgi:putative DNA primase/helicase
MTISDIMEAPYDSSAGGNAAENSEISLADEFTNQYGTTWRHIAVWGRWFKWDGQIWSEDLSMEVWDCARKIVRDASQELDEAQKHAPARALASAKTVAAVIQLSRAHRCHAALPDIWDPDPWALNTPAGIIDLKTGELDAHDPTRHCSKMTVAAPADAVPDDSVWLKFLWRVCGDSGDLVQFLQRAAGYSLTGSTREEAFFFLYGLGQNGKSKFIEAISGVLGSYHESAGMETFVASKFEQHPADLAKLRAARLVTATETEEGRRWAESKIKAITGGDQITARFMRQDFFTFKPQLKLWIAGNHKPGLRNVDPAMRRRMNLIPFSVAIPEAERDRDLAVKLKGEWPIILRWMIEGCLEWQRVGLCTPDIVRSATDDYMAQEDNLAQWLDECCEIASVYRATSGEAFESWKRWAERNGEHTGSQKKFSQRLEDRGFGKERNNARRWFAGFKLKETTQNGGW